MSKRATTTYAFGCDAPGCKSTVTETYDGQPTGWMVLLVQVEGDRKDRHYCPAHKDSVLVYLGLKKADPLPLPLVAHYTDPEMK